jgi:hypothetical protein
LALTDVSRHRTIAARVPQEADVTPKAEAAAVGPGDNRQGDPTLTVVARQRHVAHTAFHPELLIYALPGIAGAYVGLRVFHQLSDAHFQKLVNVALIASGIALALK